VNLTIVFYSVVFGLDIFFFPQVWLNFNFRPKNLKYYNIILEIFKELKISLSNLFSIKFIPRLSTPTIIYIIYLMANG
jgi:hypothetical protein